VFVPNSVGEVVRYILAFGTLFVILGVSASVLFIKGDIPSGELMGVWENVPQATVGPPVETLSSAQPGGNPN